MPAEEDVSYFPYGGIAYGSSADHYLFGGKERDTETGLDYFGARYFGSSMGRFMTPDWSEKPQGVPYAVLDDPQSLNLYSYVRNLPTSRTDPTGHGGPKTLVDPNTCGGTNEWGGCKVDVQAGNTKQQVQQQQKPKEKANTTGADVAYGETSGMYPQQAGNEKGGIYNPKNADPASAEQLQAAREEIVRTSRVNKTVQRDKPGKHANAMEKKAWRDSQAAAAAANRTPAVPMKYFFMRQGEYVHPPAKAGFGQGEPLKTYGPFVNTPGGSVAPGNELYIDFYNH
jgi:RHS repeat-associated protein